jgi:hypothetical protein
LHQRENDARNTRYASEPSERPLPAESLAQPFRDVIDQQPDFAGQMPPGQLRDAAKSQ